MNVNDIRKLFVEKYKNKEFVIDKTGIKTIEIVGAHFEADENYIFGVPNKDYIKKELAWYISQSLNVNDIENTPKIWKQVADPNGFVNSNYGWMIFSKENGNQYYNCLNELKQNPNTRRAAMIYIRPEMWVDFNKNGRNDFCCTYAVQFLIRNNVLYSYVLMRSNDAWAGYRNDFFWHKYVLNKLSNDLKIEKTAIIWNAGSLHLYQKQFYLINHYIKSGETNISLQDYKLKYEK